MGVEKRRSTLSVLFYIKRQTLLKNGEALDRLMDKDFDIKQLEQVRDVFAFCCLTGMAFADVQQLSKEHLVRDNEDNLWIRNACQKIKQMCNIPVISPAPS